MPENPEGGPEKSSREASAQFSPENAQDISRQKERVEGPLWKKQPLIDTQVAATRTDF